VGCDLFIKPKSWLYVIFSGFHTALNFLLPFWRFAAAVQDKNRAAGREEPVARRTAGLRAIFESVQSLKMASNFLVINSLPAQNHIAPKSCIYESYFVKFKQPNLCFVSTFPGIGFHPQNLGGRLLVKTPNRVIWLM